MKSMDPGFGFVDVFSPTGRLLLRLESGKWFNAPWGLAQAPNDFGAYSHNILVGQFGSGEILAFDPVTGDFKGRLLDATNKPITIDGLWAISFGGGGTSGPSNKPVLYRWAERREQRPLRRNHSS